MRSVIVGIVGGGFSGCVTAIRLLRHTWFPLRLVMFEANATFQAGGLAYSAANAGWYNSLNIQAGRVSLFREKADDFIRWANVEADRGLWPHDVAGYLAKRGSAVPRPMYSQYIRHRLTEACRAHSPDTIIEWIPHEVLSLSYKNCGSVAIGLQSAKGQITERVVEAVVVSTGHYPKRDLRDEFRRCGISAISSFEQDRLQTYDRLPPNGTVVVLGSGLSGFDVCLDLLHRGFRGSITLLSRHGLIHRTYPADHVHRIIELPRPRFLDDDFAGVEVTIRKALREFRRARKKLIDESKVSPAVASECVFKSWEPYVAEFFQRLSDEHGPALLKRIYAVVAARRIGTVPEIGNRILEHMAAGSLPMIRVVAGTVDLTDMSGGSIQIVRSGRAEIITPHLVVVCDGSQLDYSKVDAPVWQHLRECGVVCHRRTGLGVEVDHVGRLWGRRVFAVGPMRAGDELVRRGRLGSFLFSIGTLRNQAFLAAIVLLCELARPDWDAVAEDANLACRESSPYEDAFVRMVVSGDTGSQGITAQELLDAAEARCPEDRDRLVIRVLLATVSKVERLTDLRVVEPSLD